MASRPNTRSTSSWTFWYSAGCFSKRWKVNDSIPDVVSCPAIKKVMSWFVMFASESFSPVCGSTPLSIAASRSFLSLGFFFLDSTT